MADIGEALKNAAKAFVEGMGPGRYSVAEVEVVCPHCKGDTFAEGRAQLNTAGMTFIGLDWANKSAATLACARCGLVQWFLTGVKRI